MPIAEISASYENRHTLRDEPTARESLVWVIPLPDEQLAAFVYTWVDAHGQAAVAATAFGASLDAPVLESAEASVPADMGFADWNFGPVRLRSDGLLTDGQIEFHGERLTMDLTFHGFHPTYGYGANDAQCPPFWADDRTEQGGRITGTIRVDERRLRVDSFAHRDHSWGTRDWGVIQHMKWINALAEPDISVHVMQIQALGHTSLHGYVHKDGNTANVRGMEISFELDKDLLHTNAHAVITDDSDRTTSVRLSGGAGHLVWPVSPFLSVHDVAMQADIDGYRGVAYVDMSWPDDYMRRYRIAGKAVSVPLSPA